MGCHFLLQCMKVKSESEVAQSCPTLSNTMDCSLPGSSIHGILQARVLEWGAIAFSQILYDFPYIQNLQLLSLTSGINYLPTAGSRLAHQGLRSRGHPWFKLQPCPFPAVTLGKLLNLLVLPLSNRYICTVELIRYFWTEYVNGGQCAPRAWLVTAA